MAGGVVSGKHVDDDQVECAVETLGEVGDHVAGVAVAQPDAPALIPRQVLANKLHEVTLPLNDLGA